MILLEMTRICISFSEHQLLTAEPCPAAAVSTWCLLSKNTSPTAGCSAGTAELLGSCVPDLVSPRSAACRAILVLCSQLRCTVGEPGVGCLQPPGRRGLSKNKAQPSIPSVMRGGMEVAVCFLTPAVWAQRHPPPILHQSSSATVAFSSVYFGRGKTAPITKTVEQNIREMGGRGARKPSFRGTAYSTSVVYLRLLSRSQLLTEIQNHCPFLAESLHHRLFAIQI